MTAWVEPKNSDRKYDNPNNNQHKVYSPTRMSYDILNDTFVCNTCTVVPCQCSDPVKIVPVHNLTSQIQNSVRGSNTSFLTKDRDYDDEDDSGIEDNLSADNERNKLKPVRTKGL